jgi:hypothetical protein
MRRRLATLAALSVFALALGAAPVAAAGSPLTRWSLPAAELGSLCGYTFTSGTITDTFRTADAVVDPDTGEIVYLPAAHLTLHHVVAERDGNAYVVIGVEIYDDLQGHLTSKLMFIGQGGGIADNLNIVFRSYPNGDPHVYHNLGTCTSF